MKLGRLGKVFGSLLVAGLLVATPACYGPFKLTQKFHKWNGSIGEKWGQEIVFLATVIIPVYSVCMLGDAVVFNSIEFWGGENPIKTDTAEAKK